MKESKELRNHIRKTILESLSKTDKETLKEIFGLSQKERDEKLLKANVLKAADEIRAINSTYSFSHSYSDDFDPTATILNKIKKEIPNFSKLMPELFDYAQSKIRIIVPYHDGGSLDDNIRDEAIPYLFKKFVKPAGGGLLTIDVKSIKKGLMELLREKYRYLSPTFGESL